VPADYPGCPVTVTAAVAQGELLRPPRWGLWDVLITIGLTGVIGLGAGAALLLTNASTGVEVILGTAAPWVALAGWPLLVTAWRGNGPRIDLGLRLTWSDTGWGALAGFAGLLLAGVAALITQLFSPDVTSNAAEAADALQGAAGRQWMVVFAAMVMVGAPVVEELFFRGLFFGALRKRGVNTALTVIVTAVVFAAFHFEPLRFLVLLPSGIVLGLVRARTGSTGAAMVAHGVINAPGAIVLLTGLPDMSP
jgi:membrane protease YdiL (CAAX protease family)